MNKIAPAVNVIKHFVNVDPVKAAQALAALSEDDAAEIIKLLPAAISAQCLENMQPHDASEILQHLLPEPAVNLIARLSHCHAADIFRHFSRDSIKNALHLLDNAFVKTVREILDYPKESAGRIMQTDFISFHTDIKVREVIKRLRHIAKKHVPNAYCYVVGPENKLVGVLNMRDLMLASPETAIENIMRTETVKVSPFVDREELISVFTEKHYVAIPVVNETGRIIGIVNTENLIESTEEEASEDIQILFGASAEERIYSSLWFKIKNRLPWLHINLATAFLAASVVALFQDMIGRMAVLAVFLPIVAGQGGNAGIQSLSVVLRGIILREIYPKDALRLVLMEVVVGLVNGLVIGLVTAIAAWLWKGNPYLGLVVGIAMVVNMVAAGLAGALIPIAMKKLGFDPAHSSGIFLTTITDVVGFAAFLGFAFLFQSKLI